MRSSKIADSMPPSLKNWESGKNSTKGLKKDAVVDCGWGKLIFGQTFDNQGNVIDEITNEEQGKRNLGFYVNDPHVLVAKAPDKLFIDPSNTYRLWFGEYARPKINSTIFVKRIDTRKEAEDAAKIYSARHMIPPAIDFILSKKKSRKLTYMVAKSSKGKNIGVVLGIDHVACFSDPEGGSSLWSLAVDPEATSPGIGVALMDVLASYFMEKKRKYMDLSVMHDNRPAIRLYEKMGFVRVPVFCMKNKNVVNEALYSTVPVDESGLSKCSKAIISEARRRGAKVDILDSNDNLYRLTFGGRDVVCRESLTDLTSSIAYITCRDKTITNFMLGSEGIPVPRQVISSGRSADEKFCDEVGECVVKPTYGRNGVGVSVGVGNSGIKAAVALARKHSRDAVIEERMVGKDLSVLVIDYRFVAAIVRKPPKVIGDGKHTIRELIGKASRRKSAATSGECDVPIDSETTRCVAEAGYDLDDVLLKDKRLYVRSDIRIVTGGIGRHDSSEGER